MQEAIWSSYHLLFKTERGAFYCYELIESSVERAKAEVEKRWKKRHSESIEFVRVDEINTMHPIQRFVFVTPYEVEMRYGKL